MVEGPGTTRNGKKASTLIGTNRRILDIQCSFNTKVVSTNTNEDSTHPWFHGCYLRQSLSIGKELYLVFSRSMKNSNRFNSNEENDDDDDDLALRLHFGMNGSLLVSNQNVMNKNTQKSKGNPTLCIVFGSVMEASTSDTITIETYQTSVAGPMKACIARKKYRTFCSVDVCSLSFEANDVLIKMKNIKQRDKVISDVLLDQHIYPGVGNIIKVEGLHAVGVHPKQPLFSLSDEKLILVINACQSYAMKWLKSGRAPTKSVYNKTICGTCNEPQVSMQRVGGSHRTTFWCIKCQPFDIQAVNDIRAEKDDNSQELNNHNSNQRLDNNILAPLQQQVMDNSKSLQRICPTHGPEKLVLRRARNGPNASRIFFTCKAWQCNYFSWADTFFPKCTCNKRAIVLVSKTERSGGKWFFTCGQSKDKKCKYFAWAQQKDIARLGDTLTPLL